MGKRAKARTHNESRTGMKNDVTPTVPVTVAREKDERRRITGEHVRHDK